MTFAKSKQWTRPLKTAFYNRLVFRGHFFPAHVQVPLGGFRGDDSRPIRATMAFDFYDFCHAKKLSYPQIFLALWVFNVFKGF